MFSNESFRGRVGRRSALSIALGTCIAGMAGQAIAQQSAGAIFGTVTNAAPGSTILVESVDTGAKRELKVDADGRYRASQLQVGTYRVTLMDGGKTVSTRDNVAVTISGATEVGFGGNTSASGAQTLEGVSVNASALPQIDVSSVDTRSVFTAEQLQKLPVGTSVGAAALLAPGVVAGDSRFNTDGKARLAIGGSGISENAYRINGYNVTDPQSNETFFEMPFFAIDQAQVLTGGAGAQFGQSTGGVVNIVGKRGTNEWKFSARIDWTPESLRSDMHNLYNSKNPEDAGFGDVIGYNHGGAGITERFGSDGKLRQYRKKTKNTETLYSLQLSGPLIKDKLFMYAAASFQKNDGQEVTGSASYAQNGSLTAATANNLASGYRDRVVKAVKWYTKFDWNITDNHLLELTGMQDNTRRDNEVYGWSYATLNKLGRRPDQDTKSKNNNRLYIAKYTGYITDDFTVSALYGRTRTIDPNLSVIPNVPYVRANPDSPVVNQIHNYLSDANQRPARNGENKTDGWRIDLEYRLGDHDLKGGIDHQTLKTTTGQDTANLGAFGGEYLFAADPTKTYPQGIVQQTRLSNGGHYKLKLKSYYVEDNWQVSDRWLAYIGLRNESFENYNSFDKVFLSKKNQWAPRLGVAWDVNGDSSLKVYANAGRYYLALPTGVAVRGAGGSLFTTQNFSFNGIDPNTDMPLNLVPLGPVESANSEFGQTRDPRTARIKGLRSHYQDEYIVGLDKQLNDQLTVGARAIYRDLKSQVDDTSDPRPVCRYMASHYSDFSSAQDCLDNFNYQGVIFNPGRGAEFDVNVAASGQPADLRHIKLSKEDLGMPDPKRKYLSLNVYAEHPFSNNWYGRIDYTWSHSYGNTEGQVKSDIAQQDVAASQDWDYPEFMRYANGNLPNDRRHQIRGFGYYQLNPEWMLSATATANSGRPKSCIGAWFRDANGVFTDPSNGYMLRPTAGGAYHVCYGTPSPRGAKGNLPWTYSLDLGVTWTPAFADHKLAFTATVFNVFNTQKVTVYEERAMGGPVDDGTHNKAGVPNGGNPLAIYKRAVDYSAPRAVRFSVQYDF
ncbi:TonB-dependent receptor [Rothia nasimurium]|uniref:TonB-dependent receptor n=1 Tax=Luteibacter anthropi TaxID=564369 RepID=A0A7X5U6Q3_9GAMM|nr:TonB-dependent receptor [Luteibacter anthropi]NII04916.1 TonB-dependent receptor [Luteibacter anthropi]